MLLEELSATFKPFQVQATGFGLWHYLGGPWRKKSFIPFLQENK